MFASTATTYPHSLVRLYAPRLRANALALLLVLLLSALSAPAGLRPMPATPTSSTTSLADLPLEAQAAISATLGRDDHAFHASAQADGIALVNSAHGLHARFDTSGLTLKAGSSSGTVALRGYGYGEVIQAPLDATPMAAANRVTYARGALREWYLNGPLGLEQGFTLAAPPSGARSGPLSLAVAFEGWRARLDPSGQGALLTGSSGEQLRYAGLFAADADGRELPAWMEQRGAELWLRVDDAGARYPLTIDPAMTEPKLTASDGVAGDNFGFSVAIDGATVVVGAPNANSGQGAAYVFEKPLGGWASATEIARLTASDGVAGNSFGFSVAISGGTVVAGAPGATVGGNEFQGAAYVFEKPLGGWVSATEIARLTASDGVGSDSLGGSVAISGGTVVAGAPGASTGGSGYQGAAYVFEKPLGGWASATETARLTASDDAELSFLGFSMAIDGDTVVAGAPGATVGGNTFQGAAYVFEKPLGGWASATETAKLTASDGAVLDGFGGLICSCVPTTSEVAISGDTVVVGAPLATIGGNASQGAAYVFEKPLGGWVSAAETAKLTASDGVAGDLFGTSVVVDGDTVVAGAPSATIGGNASQGAAYVFEKPLGGWVSAAETAKLTASDGAASNSLGAALAISGGTVVAGAPFATIDSNSSQGTAYVFELAPAADTTAPTISISTPADGATYTRGQAVSASYSCQDEAGGSGLAACNGSVPNGSPIDTATLGSKSFTVTATDNAGNTSTLTHSYTVVDATAPTISITTPANGATYTLGQAVSASYSCQDEAGGSGLASCAGTVPNGSPIDTATVGAKSFTVNAADTAGNTSSLTHTYTVAYAFSGFFSPVDNLPVVNKANGGQSIPVKFSLGGNYGLGILAPGYPASQQVACDTSAPISTIEETTTANQGLTYAGGQYNYVWKTQKSWAGTCRLFTLRLTDGTDHIALFKFK